MTVRVPMLNTNTDTAETFRLALGGLWVPASALNARTGVTTTPVLTGTGNLTATVGPFTAMVDGTSGALQGGYPVALDTATTVTIGAGNTQARIDLISLQIKDNDYDASGLHQGQPVVTAGTPSGSPVAPATPANAIPLWTIPVPALATSLTWSTATAVYPYTAAAGGIVPVRNATDKPSAANGVVYRHRLDVPAGGASPTEWSTDGVTFTPVASAVTVQKIGSVVVSGAAVATMSIAVPAGYTALYGVVSSRGDVAASSTNLRLQFNGDTTAGNYAYELISANNSVAPASSGSLTDNINLGTPPCATATTNFFGSSSFSIPNPGSSVFKGLNGSAQSHVTTGNLWNSAIAGTWLSTSAISSISLALQSGNFVAGSSFVLYGVL